MLPLVSQHAQLIIVNAQILLTCFPGNTQGNIMLFEPTTSEHISARTIDQIAVTALAPSADCRTFAIGLVPWAKYPMNRYNC